eukprot:925551-Alexandrium_andersonii.AAC.1
MSETFTKSALRHSTLVVDNAVARPPANFEGRQIIVDFNYDPYVDMQISAPRRPRPGRAPISETSSLNAHRQSTLVGGNAA